jgi:hypothetical protein
MFREVHKNQALRSLILSKASPDAYSAYQCHIESFLFYSMHVMYCALSIGFLDDGDRLRGSTLSYITLVVDVFIFID